MLTVLNEAALGAVPGMRLSARLRVPRIRPVRER
jgi:hypothetical protein